MIDASSYKSTNNINLQLNGGQLQNIFISQTKDNYSDEEDTGASNQQMMTKIKKWRLVIQTVLLLIAVFSAHSCFSLPISFFPQKAKELGLTEIEIGAVFSFYPAFECLMSPVYGTLVSLSCYIAVG